MIGYIEAVEIIVLVKEQKAGQGSQSFLACFFSVFINYH